MCLCLIGCVPVAETSVQNLSSATSARSLYFFLNLISSYRHEFYRISRDVTCVWRRIETVAASSRSPGSCSTAQTKLRTETCSTVRSGRGVLCRPGHCSHRHQAPACHRARPRSPFVPLTLCTAGPPVYVLATRSLFAVLPRSRRLQCDYCRGPGNCSATVRRHGARLLAVHGQPDIALQDCTWPRLIVRASACTLWPLMCARPARTAIDRRHVAGHRQCPPWRHADDLPTTAPGCGQRTYPCPLGRSDPHYTYISSHTPSRFKTRYFYFHHLFYKNTY
jgi:hypothetical protein